LNLKTKQLKNSKINIIMKKFVLTAAAILSATCLSAQSWQSLKKEALNAGGDFTSSPTTVLLDSTAVSFNDLGSGIFVIR
jgi:hypothetical protein